MARLGRQQTARLNPSASTASEKPAQSTEADPKGQRFAAQRRPDGRGQTCFCGNAYAVGPRGSGGRCGREPIVLGRTLGLNTAVSNFLVLQDSVRLEARSKGRIVLLFCSPQHFGSVRQAVLGTLSGGDVTCPHSNRSSNHQTIWNYRWPIAKWEATSR